METGPFLDDLPIFEMVIFHSFLYVPEGTMNSVGLDHEDIEEIMTRLDSNIKK